MKARLFQRALIAALVVLAIAGSPPGPIRGYATHYAAGLFEKVRLARALPPAGCYTSSDWHELGSFVEVRGLRTEVIRRCEVADISAPADRARHMRDGLVELDYASAQAICGKWWSGPWRQCPVVVRAYRPLIYRVRGVQAL